MATLTNTKIKDTYDGLLKTTDNDALDVSGVTLIEDGLGNASALSVGRSGNGVSVSGLLDVSGEVQGTSLDINGDGNISGDLEINDTISGSVATNYAPNVLVGGNIVARSLTANAALIEIGGDATSAFITAGKQDGSQTSRALRFEVGTSEAMRIDSSGNVGVKKDALLAAGLGYAGDTTSAGAGKITLYDSSTGALVINGFGAGYLANSGIHFQVAGSERMRIDSSGNVGIGASTVDKALHIEKAGGGAAIKLERSDSTTSGTYGQIGFASVNGIVTGIDSISDGDSNGGHLRFFTTTTTPANDVFSLSERMRIDSSGNVGIGTTGGNGRLNVGASSASAVRHAEFANSQLGSSFSAGSFITLGRADINRSMDVGIYGNGSNEFDGKIVVNETGGSLILGTVGSERMRITSGGDVLFGTQGTPNGTSVYGAGFQNASAERSILYTATNTTSSAALMYFANPNGFIGNITVNGSTTSFNSTSDYRLKENVVEMTGALDRVDALKPSRFNYILDPEKTVDGFLAHEVQAIVPEAVTGEKDEVDEEGNPIYQGIDQSKIVPLLVGAIKELSAKVAALESQLNA